MAAGFSDKAPPSFNSEVDDYTKWKRRFSIWQSITDVAKGKQGGLLVLRLDDDTQDSILELISEEDIKQDDGATKIIGHLDGMFKKDESIAAYEIYEEFETYRRPVNLSIAKFCGEFQRRLSKVKASGNILSQHVLAFRLLKSANLSEGDEQLVKATIDKMDYDSMVRQLKKVVKNDISSVNSNMAGLKIKDEPDELEQSDTFFYGGKYRNNNSKGKWYSEKSKGSYNGNQRKPEEYSYNQDYPKKLKGRNPLDPYGKLTRCRICDSVNHWKKYCPDFSL